ncbi:hypothetical protein MPTK1_4g17330 [Marchantia polymorpha subsp. ruderalis]|uniref:Uncharacterized protein n=2 Tax=Marchantia polymorpha TaxID=3197 RepID=A0AAF6BAU1_MARPO|nr:hypothetical protein MARPO_0041s0015 [Marchantia polymorpha]BBN09125.1 hypothetical protein Mp_4g17330 [Marchantia polymorpha subsp. ruderalis]|eukprot:PTQ40113.1 hypothetical protein MARPO_0041s0015 [Marchantia polymorpha]
MRQTHTCSLNFEFWVDQCISTKREFITGQSEVTGRIVVISGGNHFRYPHPSRRSVSSPSLDSSCCSPHRVVRSNPALPKLASKRCIDFPL